MALLRPTQNGRVGSPPVQAMVSILGSTGAVLVAGVLSAKIAALFIGPVGVGRLAIAQGVISVVAVVAGLGVNSAVVRLHAARVGAGHSSGLGRIRFVAALLTACGSAAVLAAALLWFDRLNGFLFPGESGPVTLAFTLVSGVLYAWTGLLLAVLISERALRLFAVANGLGALSTPLVSAVGFWWLGVQGVAPVVLASNVASLVAAAAVVTTRPGRGRRQARREAAGEDGWVAQELLRFGVPHTFGLLALLTSATALPLVVDHRLGPADTGLFRAAFALAAAASVLVEHAIEQEFFPRISSLSHRSERFVVVANLQLRFVAVGAGVLVVGGIAGAEVLLQLLYSGSFTPAAGTLRWLLIGEWLRLVGSVVVATVAARRGTGMSLVVGSSGAVSAVVLAWVLLGSHGVAWAGAAYAASQAGALVLAVVAARRLTGFGLDVRTAVVVGGQAVALAPMAVVGLLSPALAVLVAVGVATLAAGAALAWVAWQGSASLWRSEQVTVPCDMAAAASAAGGGERRR